MLIRIEGSDLPGRTCGPGPDFPDGHQNVHVAIQGRKGQQDLFGLVGADAESVAWDLVCDLVSPPPHVDLWGAQIQGPPGKRFIYISWGAAVGGAGGFRMFRRAKLCLDAVPPAVMAAACNEGMLVGRLGLTDDEGWPLCAAVRPPRVEWSAQPRSGHSS
jgi:hypothetical protein